MNHRVLPHGRARTIPDERPDTVTAFSPAAADHAFFNPILPAPSQDPHVLWHDGLYHYCESTPAGIFLRSAVSFVDMARAPRRRVWTPPARGPMAKNLWAPELHLLDGRFYIYFAADDGRNANHRMWVLSAPEVHGPFTLSGMLETAGWAIDGTVLQIGRERYFVWSGWPGRRDGQQNLYLARMRNPLALEGPRVLLTSPDQPWERRGLPLCEGPQVLQHHGRTFVVYSASGSWTEDYCLGLLTLEGDDALHPGSWRKTGPVFHKTGHAWGVGHCGFAATPDGDEHWLLYHAKTSRRPGWSDREVRAQRFTWSGSGEPVFGEPAPRTLALPRPAIHLVPLASSA